MEFRESKKVEIPAVGSTELSRAAVLLAFHEGIPVVHLRPDGSVFAVTQPDDLPPPWEEDDGVPVE